MILASLQLRDMSNWKSEPFCSSNGNPSTTFRSRTGRKLSSILQDTSGSVFLGKPTEYGNNIQVGHVKTLCKVGRGQSRPSLKNLDKKLMIKKKSSHFAKPQIPDRCALMGMGIFFLIKNAKHFLIRFHCQLSISVLFSLNDVEKSDFLSKNLCCCGE